MNLESLMGERGITVPMLAAALGVSEKTVTRMRQGRKAPTLPEAIRMADYFGISLDELAGRQAAAKTVARARAQSPKTRVAPATHANREVAPLPQPARRRRSS